jgi:hypothetical protein
MPITRHAFPKKDCSECPIKRERLRKISKLEGDINLLKTYCVPSPKANSELDMLRFFQAQCNSGKCH